MSTKYPGGVISKTAPTPSGPYVDSTAPGIWTLEQQAYWQKLGQWPTQGNVNPSAFIENLFSTYLYTGNGSTQTITNGIDLAGKGGLVWIKSRQFTYNHSLTDTTRGANQNLVSNTTSQQVDYSGAGGSVTDFNSNGFSLGSFSNVNGSGLYASWTFRKQPKFFDVVTYTGDGTSGRAISHNLGSTPGCIIVKITSAVGPWPVFHRSLGGGGTTENLILNTTAAVAGNAYFPAVSSTTFSVSASSAVNSSGATYVAYLFAHDAGGFGLTGTDNVISCGSYTGNGSSTGPTITLGYEPQWVLIKNTTDAYDWQLYDVMRGMSDSATGSTIGLSPNTTAAEVSRDRFVYPTATGFAIGNGTSIINQGGGKMIYIAIRRGPMAVPTLGTSVFSPTTYTGNGVTGQTITSVGFPLDFVFDFKRDTLDNKPTLSRLTANNALYTNLSDAQNPLSTTAFTFDVMNGFKLGNSGDTNSNGTTYIAECFRRAPSFFDEVCYTGTGSARTISHNLGVVPELMIVKDRSRIGTLWITYAASQGNTKYADLSDPSGFATGTYWNNTSPTSSVFSVSALTDVNSSGDTYVAYLFATCAGVSKVGSYTGTGTTLQVNCGFTSGARFVLIKRTDDSGDWYVWDSARGIVAGNDPYLLLNSTAAEVTGTDYVDTYSAGFEISSTAPSAINASGGTFIFLAIA